MTVKPYYDDGRGIVIYHGRAEDILPSLGKFSLCLTDPPYGLGDKLTGGNWGKRVGEAASWDVLIKIQPLILACAENIVWFGGNYYPLPVSRCWFVWIKRDAVPTCASAELAWTSFDAPSKFCDVTIADTNAERNGHPTMKPLKLMTWSIAQAVSISGPLYGIVDPFCGSGTTLRAAKDLGIAATGIEEREDYAEIAARRLSQEVFDLR